MRTWVKSGASAVLLAAGACVLCARGVSAEIPPTERLRASAPRAGELPAAPSTRTGKALTVLGGALPGLPAQGSHDGRPAFRPDADPGAMVAAPRERPAGGGPVPVLLAGAALTLLLALVSLLTGRVRGRAAETVAFSSGLENREGRDVRAARDGRESRSTRGRSRHRGGHRAGRGHRGGGRWSRWARGG